jgi:hypothetical protein
MLHRIRMTTIAMSMGTTRISRKQLQTMVTGSLEGSWPPHSQYSVQYMGLIAMMEEDSKSAALWADIAKGSSQIKTSTDYFAKGGGGLPNH